MKGLGPKHREARIIWLAIASAIIVAIYRLFVTFMDKSVLLSKPYFYMPVEDWVTNLLIFWSLTLLLAACYLWRQALMHQRELEIIIASVGPDVLAVVVPDRKITLCNPAVTAMFGYAPEEVINQKTDVLYFDRRTTGDRREVYHSLEKFGFHIGYATGRRKNGETFPLEIVTGDLEGRRGAVVLIRDITERKRTEEQIIKAKEEAEAANRDKGRALAELGLNYARLKELEALRDNLVHMIVHDMKNPLSGIQSCLELLARDARQNLDVQLGKGLDDAMGFTGDLLEMVKSLLDVSRMEAGELPLNKTKCDLDALVGDAVKTVESLARGRNLRIAWAPSGLAVHADSDVIVRVLVNLLSNAVKFGPSGSDIRLLAERDGAMVRVSVTDEGVGVPPECHRKIFEKFGRLETQKSGKDYSTGLGLTFCKLAVEAHGGQIGVVSPLTVRGKAGHGAGSSFWFTLPAV